MTSSEKKREQLKKLGRQARVKLYEMLSLTASILTDAAYVEEHGGIEVLTDHLEATDFAHFGGKPSLRNMLGALKKNPEKSVWDERRHNIWAMIDLAKPSPAASQGKPRIDRAARIKELEVENRVLRDELSELRTRHELALTRLGNAEMAVAK